MIRQIFLGIGVYFSFITLYALTLLVCNEFTATAKIAPKDALLVIFCITMSAIGFAGSLKGDK